MRRVLLDKTMPLQKELLFPRHFTSAQLLKILLMLVWIKIVITGLGMIYFICVVLVQLAVNGFVAVQNTYKEPKARLFPVQQLLVAPYWDDIDMSIRGKLLYSVIGGGDNSSVLEQVNDFVNDHAVNFVASWALVAKWTDVCSYGDDACINNKIGVSERPSLI